VLYHATILTISVRAHFFEKWSERITVVSEKLAQLENVHDQIDYEGQNKTQQRFLDNNPNKWILGCSHALLGLIMLVQPKNQRED
jgi:hypothetical protein